MKWPHPSKAPAFVPKALSDLDCDWTNVWMAGVKSLLRKWYNANSYQRIGFWLLRAHRGAWHSLSVCLSLSQVRPQRSGWILCLGQNCPGVSALGTGGSLACSCVSVCVWLLSASRASFKRMRLALTLRLATKYLKTLKTFKEQTTRDWQQCVQH